MQMAKSRAMLEKHKSDIPDDVLDLIFQELNEAEINRDKSDVGSELAAKVSEL